ncbi:hypothetical protein ACGRPC_06060 [Vibrio diabolicus]|uniref:hypothetical protein n=1 Tax=Vibrio diabolicus TaxID=50719 RepID=UPI00374933E7
MQTIRTRLNEDASNYVTALARKMNTSPTNVVNLILRQHQLMTAHGGDNDIKKKS